MTSKTTRLALFGGEAVFTGDWPAWPVFGREEEEALLSQLKSGGWGLCPEPNAVSRFSSRFARMHGVRHALCCCNGTVALMIALRAAGVLPGDEVILPAYTFMATATAAIGIGAVPIIVDVDPSTLNIDPAAAEAAITDRTRAILPVHLMGLPADMDSILALAEKHGLKVVEDCAQAHLASYDHTPVGGLGHAGTFSFQSSKNLTAGEGGLVTTNDPEIFKAAFAFHHCGRNPDGGAWYDHPHMGQNFRMPQLQAALLESQLDRLEAQHEQRMENGRYLSKALSNIEGIRVMGWPWPDKVTSASYHILIFTFEPEVFGAIDSAVFCEALRAEGVPCHGGYDRSLQDQGLFQDPFVKKMLGPACPDYRRMDTPVSRRAVTRSVWLKQHQILSDRPVLERIALAVEKIRDHAADLPKWVK